MNLSQLMIRVVLASNSERRKELMPLLTGKFSICPPKIDEKLNPKLPPAEAAMELAVKKARSVQWKYPKSLILGCDTIVVLGDTIFGKPKDKEEAAHMIRTLAGKTHSVITGCAFVSPFTVQKFYEESKVTMYPISEKVLQEYVEDEDILDYAGAYGIQEERGFLVKSYEGSYENIMGFPIESITDHYAIRINRKKERLKRKGEI